MKHPLTCTHSRTVLCVRHFLSFLRHISGHSRFIMAQKKVSQDRKTRILFIINHSILLDEDRTVDYFFAKLEEGWVKTLFNRVFFKWSRAFRLVFLLIEHDI